MAEYEVEEFFEQQDDVAIGDFLGEKFFLNYKPNVVSHPHIDVVSLAVNLCTVPHLVEEVFKLFEGHYQSKRWFLHRAAWRRQWVFSLLNALEHLPVAIRHPRYYGRQIARSTVSRVTGAFPRRGVGKSDTAAKTPQHEINTRERSSESSVQTTLADDPRCVVSGPVFASRLETGDTELLARALWRHSSVFTWKRGDILICDNLQMHHAGMPGLGSRDLKVALWNAVSMQGAIGAGLVEIDDDHCYKTVHQRLIAFREQRSSARLALRS